jgi:hypothetical protein
LAKINDFFGKKPEAMHELHKPAQEALPGWQLAERSEGLHELHAVAEVPEGLDELHALAEGAMLEEQRLHDPSTPTGVRRSQSQNLSAEDKEDLLLLRLVKKVKDEDERDNLSIRIEEDDFSPPPKDEFPEVFEDVFFPSPDDPEEEEEYETHFGTVSLPSVPHPLLLTVLLLLRPTVGQSSV